jgi:hypothetical protein
MTTTTARCPICGMAYQPTIDGPVPEHYTPASAGKSPRYSCPGAMQEPYVGPWPKPEPKKTRWFRGRERNGCWVVPSAYAEFVPSDGDYKSYLVSNGKREDCNWCIENAEAWVERGMWAELTEPPNPGPYRVHQGEASGRWYVRRTEAPRCEIATAIDEENAQRIVDALNACAAS